MRDGLSCQCASTGRENKAAVLQNLAARVAAINGFGSYT